MTALQAVLVSVPLCPRCDARMIPWRRFTSTGLLPPKPNENVHEHDGSLWACESYRCRHPEGF